MVTRESPWDDYSRAEAIADATRMDGLHTCGVDVNKAADPQTPWMVDHTTVCYACATKQQVIRTLGKEHEKDEAWWDGRVLTVRPATDADLRAARAGKLAQQTRTSGASVA